MGIPLITNFRFRFLLWDGRIAGAVEPPELLRGKEIRIEPAFSVSRAMVFVDSGGSFMCDASVGKDQSEGDALKNTDGVCGRPPSLYCEVLALSMDVRV